MVCLGLNQLLEGQNGRVWPQNDDGGENHSREKKRGCEGIEAAFPQDLKGFEVTGTLQARRELCNETCHFVG